MASIVPARSHPRAALRGRPFDRTTRSYVDDIVVFASPR
jgi:hypothetical protein